MSFVEFLYWIKKDKVYFDWFVEEIMVNVIEMFCDFFFYKVFCYEIFLRFVSYLYICIWYVGCFMGEEVYLMVIFFKEVGLFYKLLIYVMDINLMVLEQM